MSVIIDSKTAAAKLQAVKARDDLAAALDAIEDKINVQKRVKASYQERPLPWIIGGAAAAAVVIGLVAWAIFSDD